VLGCKGTAGSGTTLCTGRVGLVANFLSVAIRFSHISVTSSIRCKTCRTKANEKERNKLNQLIGHSTATKASDE